jgi:hypothetical protein
MDLIDIPEYRRARLAKPLVEARKKCLAGQQRRQSPFVLQNVI